MSLARGVRLDGGDRSSEVAVLVSAEGKVQLNRIAAEILRLCDGSRSRDEIVTEMLRRSQDPARTVEMTEFLDAAQARGWIREGPNH